MRRLVVALALTLMLGGSAALAQSGSPAPASSPAATAASPAASPAAVVHLKNFAFAPDTVTIAPGQSVRFVNQDETPHTVTANDKSFDSGNLDQGKSWTHVFAKEGTYAYLCAYHTYMKGKVVVKAP